MITKIDINSIEKQKVVELLIENLHPGFADAVVQMDLEDGHLYGCAMTTGTIENPDNHVIEIARISQNNYFDNMCCCDECSNYGCTYATRHEFNEDLFNDCLYEEIIESLEYNGFTQKAIDMQLSQ